MPSAKFIWIRPLFLGVYFLLWLPACGEDRKAPTSTRTSPPAASLLAPKTDPRARKENPQIQNLEKNFQTVAQSILAPQGIIATLEVLTLDRSPSTLGTDALTKENVTAGDFVLKIKFTPDSKLLAAAAFKKAEATELSLRMAFQLEKFSYLEFTVKMDLLALLQKIEGRKVSLQEFALYMRDSDQLKTLPQNYLFDERTQSLRIKNFIKRENCESNFYCTNDSYGAEATFKSAADVEGLSNLMLGLLVTGQDLDELSQELQKLVYLLNAFDPEKLRIPILSSNLN